MPADYPSLQHYLEGRAQYRATAGRAFLSRPGVNDFMCLLGDYVARDMLMLSGRDLRPIANGIYVARLMVSFTRTHFIAADCVVFGELIEAVTLIRKQTELVARLNELERATVDSAAKLFGKTPNVAALKSDLKRAYGLYSEIAHSAKFESLELLGFVETESGAGGSALFPVCEPHAYVTLTHLALVVFELYFWRHQWMVSHFHDYDASAAERWFVKAVSAYQVLTQQIESDRSNEL